MNPRPGRRNGTTTAAVRDKEASPARAPQVRSLAALRREAMRCRACPLWEHATQTVFGEGRRHARVILVGEQPGDREDLTGEPFVGPAGKLLERALETGGIDSGQLYVTNAVKHFKFELRGKRRIHKKPAEREISACRQWLAGELALIKPRLIVAMGTTAARALFRQATAIGKNRGHIIDTGPLREEFDADVLVTVHPSSLLRARPQDRTAAFEHFVLDLKLIVPYLKAH